MLMLSFLWFVVGFGTLLCLINMLIRPPSKVSFRILCAIESQGLSGLSYGAHAPARTEQIDSLIVCQEPAESVRPANSKVT
jgi:hypothetical protein